MLDSCFPRRQLGWHRKRADFRAQYNVNLPTGKFEPGGTGNTGLGIFGNEVSVGSTIYLDDEKGWSLAGNFALEFHRDKRGANIQVALRRPSRADWARRIVTRSTGRFR